jgi:hypothetical protein
MMSLTDTPGFWQRTRFCVACFHWIACWGQQLIRHTVPAAVQKFRLLHTAPLYFDMGSKRPFILSAINLAIRRLFPVAEK